MLQGSLDNFALDEVLGLLSSTAKTGRLDLKGDRGSGSLSLHEGRLVDASASYTANGVAPEDVVFELLRYENGTFIFDVGEVPASETARDVNDVLTSAEGRLADWRTIEAVVPSLNHRVTPVGTLPADEVSINRAEWSTLILIAAGCSVSLVCDELNLGEVEGSRQIKGLAERGLVTVGPPGSGLAPTDSGSVLSSTPAPPPVPAYDGPSSLQPTDPFARPADPAPSAVDQFQSGSETSGPETAFSSPLSPDPITAASTPAPPSPPPVPDLGARPPMPPAPTAADLEGLSDTGSAGAFDTPSALTVNGGDSPKASDGAEENGEPEAKPGGLLMRYLKSDE